MSDLVGNPEDRFSRVAAHFTAADPRRAVVSNMHKVVDYENTPMQYTENTENVLVVKMKIFTGKRLIFFLFLLKTQIVGTR